ncbi:MAG: poly-gamma-glutamate synthase PgsB [Bradymonadia bacterium]
MMGLTILSTTAAALITLGVLEQRRHLKALGQIPIRIHVNGTRGKSSVTRLIAAGLRAGGIRTVAKTTGTLPRLIGPDGTERPIERPGRANVIEQIHIVARAAEAGAEALVVECMALQPYLQWLSESRFIKATHGVITNARPDHLDVMGPSEIDVARALAGMVPTTAGATLYTAERDHIDVIAHACTDRGARLVDIDASALPQLAPEITTPLEGFPYLAHGDNVALALKICVDLGVDPQVALEGMWGVTPDPGATTVHTLEVDGRPVVFYNGFAANDPESTEALWRMALERHPDLDASVALINCRADRHDRSRQLGEAIGRWPLADEVALMGSGTDLFARAAHHVGVPDAHVTHVEHLSAIELVAHLLGRHTGGLLIVGMGNIGGLGLPVVDAFRALDPTLLASEPESPGEAAS